MRPWTPCNLEEPVTTARRLAIIGPPAPILRNVMEEGLGAVAVGAADEIPPEPLLQGEQAVWGNLLALGEEALVGEEEELPLDVAE